MKNNAGILELKCFKKDLLHIEPIIFMQEYETMPYVDTIILYFEDGSKYEYYINKIKDKWVYVARVLYG